MPGMAHFYKKTAELLEPSLTQLVEQVVGGFS